MFWLDVVSRVVHVSMAIALAGGSFFALVALHPSLTILEEEQRRKLATNVAGRWKRFVHLGILLFLASGFYNYYQMAQVHAGDSRYHMLLGIKMLLGFFVFFVASAMVGRSAKLQPMRDDRGKWLGIVVTVAVVIVSISGFLKVRGVPLDLQSEPPAEMASSEAE